MKNKRFIQLYEFNSAPVKYQNIFFNKKNRIDWLIFIPNTYWYDNQNKKCYCGDEGTCSYNIPSIINTQFHNFETYEFKNGDLLLAGLHMHL